MTRSEPHLLPQAPWTRREDLARLVHAIGPDKLRWVGGAVRDTLLGLDAKDVDCATMWQPAEVIAKLNQAGIRYVPTGIDHGTVTAILPDGPVEITSLRRDVTTDGRRATIRYATDWREDAARRDFTINALYAEPESLAIHDYFNGLADLAAGRVRFIGNPHDRIREDHLRILRYFRFQARFGTSLDQDAEQACVDLRDTLKGLSRERVAMELLNLLSLPDPVATIARMHRLAILPVILPETGQAEITELKQLISAERAHNIKPDSVRRLAALLPPDPAIADSVSARLRLSKRQRQRLALAAARTTQDAQDPRALAYWLGQQAAIDRLLLQAAPLDPLYEWEPPRFPLKGGDIVARGIKAGPDIARIMQAVEARWVAEGFPPARRIEDLLAAELASSHKQP